MHQALLKQLDISDQDTSAYSLRRRSATPIAVSLLLAAAAVLKGYQLSTDAISGTQKWLNAVFVIIEAFLAVWLFIRFRAQQARLAASIAFTLFAYVSLWHAINGERNCGCFGSLQINPWYTFVLDGAVLIALSLWDPETASPPRIRRWPVPSPGMPILALGIVAFGVMAMAHRLIITASHPPSAANEEPVLLQPDTWAGGPFPLLEYIDVGDRLAKGNWLVLLYHRNCPVCLQAIDDCEKLARNPQFTSASGIAFIEVPDGNGSPASSLPLVQNDGCLWGRLDNSKNWFLRTPVILRLQRGHTAAISHGTDNLAHE